MKKVCFLATFEMPVKAFLLEHLRAMSGKYDVTLVINTRNVHFLEPLGVNVTVIALDIRRKISVSRDFTALVKLFLLFRNSRFAVVHSIMPKAGFLGMCAAFFARIPVRIHTFTGQVWVTRTGVKRWLIKSMDRLIAYFSTHILVDSFSQKEFLIGHRIVSENKARVLANGSICGVDPERFHPDLLKRANIRQKHKIPESDIVFLFLGRLNRDKGVLDLTKAFARLCRNSGNISLILVGDDEENIQSKIKAVSDCVAHKIHFVDYTDRPEEYMAAADIFCLPSYREGFGNVIIEAGATGIPSIGSNIYGIIDSLENGLTGLLCEPGDIRSLEDRMITLMQDAGLRKKMGETAKDRALRYFKRDIVVSALLAYYETFS